MTLNEILESVRDDLGESGQQYWKDPELERWAYLTFNRLARRGLCVPAEVKTNSLPGVQEYQLPPGFGELMNVRYIDEPLYGAVPLVYVDKQSIVTAYGTLYTIGTPYACYTYQDKLGLYPLPHKPPVLDCSFEGKCETFTDIFDREGEGEPYACRFEVSIEHSTGETGELDPCRVQVGHISVYLRRKGLPYDGSIRMRMRPVSDDEDYTVYSKWVSARDIDIRPEWLHFDFMLSPVELNETQTLWELTILADSDYHDVTVADQSGPGVQIGVTDENIAYLQMHRHRKDIEIDFYRNACPRITDADEELGLPFFPPLRYHDTAVSMIVEQALRKGQYDLPAAADYRRRNDEDIRYARSQSKIKTKGDIMRVPQDVRLRQNIGPYVDVVNGRFVGRAW